MRRHAGKRAAQDAARVSRGKRHTPLRFVRLIVDFGVLLPPRGGFLREPPHQRRQPAKQHPA